MDQHLKHRLTGAIILVSVAVIFIPVILEGPDNECTPLSHSIPEARQLEYKAHLDVPAPIEAPAPVKPTAAQKPAEPAKTAVPATKPTPKPKPVKLAQPATKSLSGWYVQVGSFSQEMNAGGLSKRLELSGYETRLQKAKTVRMPDHPPGNQVLLIHQAKATPPVAHQLTVTLHGVEPATQGDLIIVLDEIKPFSQLLNSKRRAILPQVLHDVLPTGNRVLILLGLPRLMRIQFAGRLFGLAF